jgi:hypothetical protein
MVPGTLLRSALQQLARLLIHLLQMRVSVQAPASIDITIAAQVTPVFTAIGPLCVGATAPPLPTLSNNGITGTWNRLQISTATAGTTTYTFTPDAGQCATATTTR